MLSKKLLPLLVFLTVGLASAQTSQNQSAHFYLQPALVIVDFGKDFKPAATLSGAAGVAWSKHHAAELEYTQFTIEPDVSQIAYDLKHSLILATYKYSFLLPHGFAVYVGGSLGQLDQKATAHPGYYIKGEDSGNATVYGLTSGVSYTIDPNIILDGGFKLLHHGDTGLTSGDMILLQAGVRFQF